jgi:hypothetical protein
LRKNCPSAGADIGSMATILEYGANARFAGIASISDLIDEESTCVVSVGVGEKKFLMLADTGASITLISNKVPFDKEVNTSKMVRFANGHVSKLTCRRRVRVNVGGKIRIMWSYVAEGLPTDIVLGCDYMKGTTIIDLTSGKINFSDHFGDASCSVAEDLCLYKGKPYKCLRNLKLDERKFIEST